MRKKILLASLIACVSVFSLSEVGRASEHSEILAFRADSLAAFSDYGYYQYSPELAWTPKVYHLGSWPLIAKLGGSMQKSAEGFRYLALNAQALLSTPRGLGISFEAGPGVQKWLSTPMPMALEIGGNLRIALPSSLPLVAAAFAGYTGLKQALWVHEVCAGLELSL